MGLLKSKDGNSKSTMGKLDIYTIGESVTSKILVILGKVNWNPSGSPSHHVNGRRFDPRWD